MSHNNPARRALGAPGSPTTGVSFDIQPQASKNANDLQTTINKRGISTRRDRDQAYTPLGTRPHKAEPSRKKRRCASYQQLQPNLDQSGLRRGSHTTSDDHETVHDGVPYTTPVPDKPAADAGYKVDNTEGRESRRSSRPPATDSKGPNSTYASFTSGLRRPLPEKQLTPKSNTQNYTFAGEVKGSSQQSTASAGYNRGTVSNRKRLVDLLAESKNSHNIGAAQEIDVLCTKSSENPEDLGNLDMGNAREAVTPMLSRLRGTRVTYARQRSFLGDPMRIEAAEHGDVSVLSPEPGEARQAHITDRNVSRASNSDDEETDSRPVRSIHELRQAGDNARFRESVEAIFEDIEDSFNSLSGRCSSFTQLCAKLLEPAFVRRFSEYGFSERLVRCTADNQDILTAFLVLCAYRLICLNGSSSHTSLRSFWTKILQISHKLINMKDDILALATGRTTGLSKAVQGSLKKVLPQISSMIFEQKPSPRLSPCLVTLSCIQFCLTTFLEKGDDIGPLPATLIDQIVELLISQREDTCSLLIPETFQLMEMSFLILETYSMLPEKMRHDHRNSFRLLFEHHNKFLQSGQCGRSKQISMLYTRVVLNLTNNEPSLCEQIATPDMVSDFVKLATTGLPDAPKNTNVEEDNSCNAAILALGVLINLSEQSKASRAAFLKPVSDSTSLLHLLTHHFSASCAFVDQARSVSEVHYNVVIGYLSILLVILCLDEDAFTQIKKSSCGEGLPLVLSTAEEFLQFHQKVEQDSQLFETWSEGGKSYYPTIENTFSRIIKYNGQDYATEIVDTAGQDEYSILNSKHFIGIHGYIIAYSVASRQSFDMVRVIRDKILNHLGADHVPLVLVGNKSDLKFEQRQVSLDEGRQLCEEFHCAFTEASARLDYNVAKAFDLMIGEIEKSQNPSQPAGGNKCAVM
ncbi:Rheb small monomeric GTPase RhbA [Aspergillus sclerotiicarbonarius CBS 121057]|uniref:Rheb small monomeric GTPase RhbA n=1 Tax=Aspergillus sclerotiicarbonarius (strain CBS 121057 / IBT 28362) TaxID=1448318 RepID=A0A319FM03_ASPSB|nr:Rheb small monomeric GTPase RhbA [Aspergillus sclerotiicarbonarius CBS 121057]